MKNLFFNYCTHVTIDNLKKVLNDNYCSADLEY